MNKYIYAIAFLMLIGLSSPAYGSAYALIKGTVLKNQKGKLLIIGNKSGNVTIDQSMVKSPSAKSRIAKWHGGESISYRAPLIAVKKEQTKKRQVR